MACKTAALGSLVKIMTGAPMSRAKKIAESDEPINARVLVPAAMSNGRIDDAQLVTERVSKVKGELFTREGDVVVKASTPYDCVFIDKGHEGLLVTSFGLILRPASHASLDMRFLAIYLGLEQANKALQSMSKGMTIQLIKKRDIGDLQVPIPDLEAQLRLASLFECTQKRKEFCRSMIEKSDLLLQSEFSRTIFDND